MTTRVSTDTRDGFADYFHLPTTKTSTCHFTAAEEGSDNLFLASRNLIRAIRHDSEHTSRLLAQDHIREVFSVGVLNTEILGKYMEEFSKFIRNRTGKESLAEALKELEELDGYAAEEELLPPSPIAKELAQNILGQLTSELPRDYSVSLWEDGDVIVYSAGGGWRVSIYCRANGGAAFYVNSPDERDQESQYQSARDLPIDLIIDALKKIPT